MKQLSIITENRLGVVTQITEALAEADINIETLDARLVDNFVVVVLTVDHYDLALQVIHQISKMNIVTEDSPPNPTNTATQRALRVPLTGVDMSLALVQEHSAERSELESGISRKFASTYGAELSHFLPNLLRLKVSDELGAVVGIRGASKGSLFLEQYLDLPIEQSVARAFNTPVDRDQIIEIGNLAANVPGFAYSLFAVLATVLNQAGYRWVACTATPQVAAMLARIGFSSTTICSADPARLENGSAAWGEYYATRPRVIAGDVRSAAAKVAENRDMAVLMRQLAQPIAQMAASLKKTAL